ncbi:MAG TPA: aminoglycoside phosphotransferase family protein, partial [Thermomicrobiales bacterium]|nr:aminoglycoside phosphotransferase family protein [Thermomicrobiales bacterium]
MPPVEVPEIAVRALLRRWFPGQDPISERMRSGGSTPVYRVTVDDVVMYLRLAEEPGERRDAEVRVHELLRELGVPLPRVLRFEPDPPELDRSAAPTSVIPGRPIGRHTRIAAFRRIAHAAGQDLAAINAIPVQGYGWVDFLRGEDRHLVAEHPIRAAWVLEHLSATEPVIASGCFGASRSAAVDEAMWIWAGLPDAGSSRLAHGDFDATHIYADPETHTYAGIIDFGEIRGADPLYDLGHVWMHG